jgi:hypothetical protein
MPRRPTDRLRPPLQRFTRAGGFKRLEAKRQTRTENVLDALMDLEPKIRDPDYLASIVAQWSTDTNFYHPDAKVYEGANKRRALQVGCLLFAFAEIAEQGLRSARRVSRHFLQGAEGRTMTTQEPTPFDPQKVLWDAIGKGDSPIFRKPSSRRHRRSGRTLRPASRS